MLESKKKGYLIKHNERERTKTKSLNQNDEPKK